MSSVWNEIFNTPSYQERFDSVVNTTLDNFNFMTIDATKANISGRTVTVNTYKSNGNPFAIVPEGNSTSTYLALDYTTKNYTVETMLGQGRFTQEGVMDMPDIANKLADYLRGCIKQKVTGKVIDAWYGIRNFSVLAGSGDSRFFDALTNVNVQLNLERGVSEREQLVAYCNLATYQKLQKEGKSDFKFVEKFAEMPNIFMYGGLPIVPICDVKYTDLETNSEVVAKIADDNIIVAPKSAVKFFSKEDFRTKLTESDDMRTGKIAVNGTFYIALVDSKYACIIAPEITSTTTMAITDTSVSAEKVAGTADTGIEVDVFIDGVYKETVVASSNAWETEGTYTGTASAVFHKRGYADKLVTA